MFIVTYGRSGSTLLQGLLNALPGYLIRGENNDVLGELQDLYERLPRFSDVRSPSAARQPVSSTPEMPFFGFERFGDETLAVGLRRFWDFMLAEDVSQLTLRCLGFKEIRYTPDNVPARVDFLRKLYPGCAVIYNVRKPEDVVASEFQRNKPVEYIQKFNNVLADLDSVDPDSFLVRYEDVVAGAGTLPGLYKFLDEPFDVKTFDSVLARKHSYHSRKKGSAYSNVPASVQVMRKLRNIDLFIVDKLATESAATHLEGFMLAEAGTPDRRFAKLSDDRGCDVAFTARYALPSPKLARKMASDAAGKARFQVSFKRQTEGEHRLFFDDGELAAIVRAARSA